MTEPNADGGENARLPEHWIELMTQRLTARFDPQRIVLFGSRAHGGARPDSDVDLLVVLDEVGDRTRAVEMRKAVADLPITKDIFVTTPDEID